MGITERVEQLNRVLEAMNAWHAASEDEPADGSPRRAAETPGADENGGEEQPPVPAGESEPSAAGPSGAPAAASPTVPPPHDRERPDAPRPPGASAEPSHAPQPAGGDPPPKEEPAPAGWEMIESPPPETWRPPEERSPDGRHDDGHAATPVDGHAAGADAGPVLPTGAEPRPPIGRPLTADHAAHARPESAAVGPEPVEVEPPGGKPERQVDAEIGPERQVEAHPDGGARPEAVVEPGVEAEASTAEPEIDVEPGEADGETAVQDDEPRRYGEPPEDEAEGTRPAGALVDDLLPALPREAVSLEVAAEVVESLGLGYHLGSAVERIATASKRGREGVDPLKEAVWLIERYISLLETRPIGADLHATSARLARTGDAIARLRALSEAMRAEPAAATAPEEAPGAEAAPSRAADVQATDSPEPAGDARPAAGPPAVPATTDEDADDEPQSFAREIAFMALRWTIMAAAVIVVVLAVTLIGQWR